MIYFTNKVYYLPADAHTQAHTSIASLRTQVIGSPIKTNVKVSAAPCIGLQGMAGSHLRLPAAAGVQLT